MKKLLLLGLALISISLLRAQDTFSIIAVDPATGEVGSAGATCVFNIPGGSLADIITKIIPGKGGVNSQAYVCIPNVNLNNAIEQMEMGLSPEEIIDWLVNNDACSSQNFNPEFRQYGIADLDDQGMPRTAGWTGSLADDYKEDRQGANYSVQGNILLDQSIIDNMEANFVNTKGTLADKLMAALQGANVAGADARCLPQGTSSAIAYLRVYGPNDDPESPMIDLEAEPEVGVEPIDALQDLYDAFLGAPSNELNENIALSPNPVQDRLNITTVNGIEVDDVSVYDINGKLIMQVSNSGESQIFLDTANLPTGVYFAQISTAQGILTKRFIKQ